MYGPTGLGKHYETGEELPRWLFAKLREQQQYQAGMVMLRQLYFGLMDLELHHRYDPAGADKDLSPFDVQRRIALSGLLLLTLWHRCQHCGPYVASLIASMVCRQNSCTRRRSPGGRTRAIFTPFARRTTALAHASYATARSCH